MRGAAGGVVQAALVAALLATQAGSACAQDPDALGEFESWVTLKDENPSDPPWVRAQVGLLGWIETRSEVEIERTTFDDLEGEQGLDSGGLGAWIELSIGQKIRGGVDATYVKRLGDLAEQDERVVIDGRTFANVGDEVKAHSTFATVGLLVQWDALYGETYRIGLIGGVRYFRVETTLRAFRGSQIERVSSGGELVSPFFGGEVLLTPFAFFSVFTRVQFMNWSWHSAGLKEASFFELRLGASCHVIPETLSLSLEYRFMAADAQSSGDDEAGVSASGVVFSLTFSF